MAWWRWSSGTRGGGAGGVLGDLLDVFQPSRHHLVEEQERRRHHAQLPDSGAPGAPGVDVDLEAGIAYLPPGRGDPGRGDPGRGDPGRVSGPPDR
jgi:hypothetical protein